MKWLPCTQAGNQQEQTKPAALLCSPGRQGGPGASSTALGSPGSSRMFPQAVPGSETGCCQAAETLMASLGTVKCLAQTLSSLVTGAYASGSNNRLKCDHMECSLAFLHLECCFQQDYLPWPSEPRASRSHLLEQREGREGPVRGSSRWWGEVAESPKGAAASLGVPACMGGRRKEASGDIPWPDNQGAVADDNAECQSPMGLIVASSFSLADHLPTPAPWPVCCLWLET